LDLHTLSYLLRMARLEAEIAESTTPLTLGERLSSVAEDFNSSGVSSN
jgi:hypothetical protein